MSSEVKNNLRLLLAAKARRLDVPRITLTEMADDTGISRNTLSLYANGKVSRFDADTLIKMCDYLECSVGDFLEYPKETGQELSNAIAMAA